MPVLDGKRLIENRVSALWKFHKTAGILKAELDLSGGIDSAVMAWLLVRALGPENVLLVHTRIDTDPKQTTRAVRIAKCLGTPFVNYDLTPIFHALADGMAAELTLALCHAGDTIEPSNLLPKIDSISKFVAANPTVLGSLRSTLRAPIGRGFNRMFGGGIRHGTGNECEDRFLRFYQKGGDGEVDTNPIEMLSKSEVFQLAYAIAIAEKGTAFEEIFKELIVIKPSPDLWGTGDAHNDEDELLSWTKVRFTYGRVDPDTGNILEFGTIERMSRLLDAPLHDLIIGPDKCEDVIFGGLLGAAGLVSDRIVTVADKLGIFPCFPDNPKKMFEPAEVTGFIFAAARAERQTRHKANGNIPTLGTRAELVAAGILSDKLEA